MKPVCRGWFFLQIGMIVACLLFMVPAADGAETKIKAESLGDIPPDQAASVLDRLSDEEIRRLALQGVAQPAGQAVTTEPKTGLNSLVRRWLHALDRERAAEAGIARLMAAFPRLPGELLTTLATIGGGKTASLFGNLLLILGVFLVGAGAEWHVCRLIGKVKARQSPVQAAEPADIGRWGRLLHLLPEAVRLAVFGFTPLLVFLLLDVDAPPVRTTFMAVLLALLFGRGLSLLARLLCSPENTSLRILPLNDGIAKKAYQAARFLIWYVASAMMFLSLLVELGIRKPAFLTLGFLFGTVLIILVAASMMTRKAEITRALLTPAEGEDHVAWTRQQLAAFWPLLALLYLFAVWLVWISSLAAGGARDSGALFISLLIVPIYLLLDRIGQWLAGSIISALGIGNVATAEQESEEPGADHVSSEEGVHRVRGILTRVFRWFTLLVLAVWLMYLWGMALPLFGAIVKAAFNILVTFTLALFLWRFSSRFIERKLAAMDGGEEEKKNDDDEFGATVQRGRSYTILPMLRTFIASTLLVMVTLIVLSSIGMEIGPLLAGAGVAGMAIGFGAKKMVSDMFSGLFYLLDDAFRVGEYIQAGAATGTVEAITLRNVMLRHNLGMLQIVPHSDLGPVTNFMRGGYIVKFNLEFPYDVDVDKVRKIIKKVGEAMLADKELGPDFILPLKSQGVSEITNSIMIIRVKFTARPERQYRIRREAFRRITEALAAKGIHYAHRKVIVEVSQEGGKPPTPEQVRKAIEAGAATGSLDPLPGQEQKAKGEPSGMPDM